MQTVMQTCEELRVHHKPVLIIFNKIDLLKEQGILQSLPKKYPDAIFLSATRNIGVESLKQKMIEFIEKNFVRIHLRIGVQNQKFIHFIHSVSHVIELNYRDHLVEMTLKCDLDSAEKIRSLYHKYESNKDIEIIEEVPVR